MPSPSTKPTKSRKKSAVTGLTETQTAVAEAVLDGATITKAAEIAGCRIMTAHRVVTKSPDVKAYLDAHRSELRSALQIDRAEVITGFMEAIDTARLAADPGTMIRGWSEIGKMLGLYAPEKKEITLTAGQRAIQSKYEIMSDEELLAIAEGRHPTIIDHPVDTE